MTTTKVKKLIELVRGKTLLRDASTERDVILQIYGFDIDRIKTSPYFGISVHEFHKLAADEREAYAKEWLDRKAVRHNFKALLRRGRKKGLDFYAVEDEAHVRRVVEIVEGNQEYLLKRAQHIEKVAKGVEAGIDKMKYVVNMPEKLREELVKRESLSYEYNSAKKCWPYRRQDIDKAVSWLKRKGQLGKYHLKYGTEVKYTPNYESIRRVFADNIRYVLYKRRLDADSGASLVSSIKMKEADPSIGTSTSTSIGPYLFNMLKEIVVSDFNGKNYRNGDIDEHTIKMTDESDFGYSPPREEMSGWDEPK